MSAMTPEERFEPIAMVEVLQRHAVDFLIIGGIAGRLHGSTTMTRDLDICHAWTPQNLERLATALREFEATLRGAEPGLPFKLDARTLRNGRNFTFSTKYGSFDCLADPGGGMTYELLLPNAEWADLDGVRVRMASLDDLIRMKRAAGRRKDLIEVENLSALREVREEAASYRARAPRSVKRTRPRAH